MIRNIINKMIKAIYANTWDGLTVKMIGYYHDHCYHYYSGPTNDIPPEYKRFRKSIMKYVFIYEEDEPLKPKENEKN